MASRSLGTLTLDLIARTAGFKAGMTQAERSVATSLQKIESSFAGLGTAFRTALGGLSIGLLIHKFTEETSKAQKAIAQLNAAILSSGNSAGFTTPQLVKMSKEIQNTTTYSDEAAIAAETMLIQFGKLGGEQFERALKLSADFAAASGQSLEEASLAIGRSTAGVARGILKLAVVGATFSKSQQKLIADLRASGKAAEANEIIFRELERAIGGRAVANANTLGGALEQLKHKFDDLFELDASKTGGVVSVIKLISDNLDKIAVAAFRAAIAYAAFKTAVLAVNLTKGLIAYLAAAHAANLETFQAAAAARAKAVAELREAVAAEAVTKAELDRTFAMVQGTRATYQRIVADEAATASAATRATVARNAARAEASFLGAAGAQALAAQKVGTATVAAAAAQGVFAKALGKTGNAAALLLTPFRGLIAFAASNPFTAIAVGVAATVGALFTFRDEIKLSEDGVVTLANASQAAFELIAEAIQPAVDAIKITFVAAVDVAKEALAELAPVGQFSFEVIKKAALDVVPGLQVMAFAVEKAWDKVAERAREIAAMDKLLKQTGGLGAALATTRAAADAGSAVPDVADPEAVKKVEEMIAKLKEQTVTLEEGAVAALKFSIAEGDLKETFGKLGPETQKYTDALIAATAAQERANKAKEDVKKSETATKQIQDQIIELETLNATFDQGEHAIFEYSLAHGELAKTLALTGKKQEELTEKLRKQNAELEKKQLAKQLRDIGVEILELRGQTAEAIVVKFDIEHANLKEALTRTSNTAGLEDLEKLRDLTIKQAEFNELLKQQSEIEDDLARQEERIRNSQEVGALTELEALGQIGDAREKSSQQLSVILEKLRAIAEATGNKEMLANVENFKVQIEGLQSKVELVAQKINGELKESFSNALGDWVKGTKSFGDAFSDMLKDIQNKLIDLIAQNYIEKLFKGLGGGGGGLGGFLASFFGFEKGGYLPPGKLGVAGEGRKPELAFSGRGDIAKLVTRRSPLPGRLGVVGRKGEELIHGGTRGLTIINHKESVKLIKLMRDARLFPLSSIPRFATGGYLPPGRVGLAGHGTELVHAGKRDSVNVFKLLERSFPSRDFGGRGYPGQPVMLGKGAQPELYVPDAPGRFVPNAELKGKQEINIYNTIQAPNGTVSRQTDQQIATATARAIGLANRRNG